MLPFSKKIAGTQKYLFHFFFSLKSLLSEYKFKFNIHHFIHSLTNTATPPNLSGIHLTSAEQYVL